MAEDSKEYGDSAGIESKLNEIDGSFPERKRQIRELYNLIGEPEERHGSSIFIYGGPSTGKSSITKTMLRKLNIKHAFVNLTECYTSKILFESILNKLSDHKIDPSVGQPYAKCDNVMDFVLHLQNIHNGHDLNGTFIVLDNAEKLRTMEFNLLPVFLRFREVSELSISVIFITELPFQKFYGKQGLEEPIKIYFPQYNKDELLNILAGDVHHAKQMVLNNYDELLDFDGEFYRNYVNVFLSVFYRVCRDLSELRYMSRINFLKYCEPIMNKETPISDSMALFRKVAPTLRSSLEVLYLRIADDRTPSEAGKQSVGLLLSKENVAKTLELPFYAKYLLIAAFLASYNPAKDDKRFFVKFHGKKIKTKKDIKMKSKVSEQLNTQLGPKPFSLDRLLAIFYAILDENIGFNNNLLVQLSSLVELQLLSSLSDSYVLDGHKYKCNVNFDFIQTVSKMVGFSIRKYLSDFSHM
ncbi:origin recognition complex subunit 5 isoform X2 [Coccinella septempunctata]|uniref:origin recognition complex subunit 5 isoform X2 n=1 Tax=Coccinella septempunctata TaxID=41139 RepID=UPI001D072DF0|nr:origin recognition complex subunit 5 isoform X2 [Coccinella septempunctata]